MSNMYDTTRAIFCVCWLTTAHALKIYEYTSPLVSVKETKAWIINGNFNLVHVINLDQFERQLDAVAGSMENNFKDMDMKHLLEFHLQQIRERIELLKPKPKFMRKQRSINWIGSALKWVAGTPDAADWNAILQSQQAVIDNNNNQYKVNEKTFKILDEMTRKINWIIDKTNNEIRAADIQKFQQDILHQVLLLKEQINEIIRACQMAKSNIVNTNLLSHEEVNMIVNEFETLPYGNEIEAIEFGTPSIYSNNSMLLYILSIPKVKNYDYNMLLVRPTIFGGKQVNIDFKKVLINQEETYGISGTCLSINNSTVCKDEALEKIPENSCLPKLLKGGHAICSYRTNVDEVIELIQEDTIFLTNFQGVLKSKNSTQMLSGTFIVQLEKETVQIKNNTYTSSSSTVLQVLPSILTNITKEGHKIDIQFVRDLSIRNIKHLENLTERLQLSTVSDAVILLLVLSLAYIIWRKVNGNLNLPTLQFTAGNPETKATTC